MRKQNILEILCKEYLDRYQQEQDNFNSCIDDFDKCITDYIIPFIKTNKDMFDFNFDLTADNKIDHNKSELLLELVCDDFKKLISIKPDFFKKHQQENGFEYACYKICMCIMIGNIDIYKKILSTL